MRKPIVELKIRGINAGAIARIDELAKKKGMSRNKLLKMYLENLSVMDEVKEIEDRYINAMNSFTKVIENNANELERIRIILEDKNK